MMTVGIGSSEKINVQQVGTFGSDREIGDIEVVGNYAYVLQLGDLVVLSVTDPTNPVEVSRITPPTNTGFGSITSSEKYIYVAASDYSIGTTLMIYDINNPTTPKLVGQYTNHDSTEIIEVSNDYAYLLSYGKGCFILDVSNPVSPQLVGQYILNDITNLDVSDQYLHLVAGHYLTGNSQTGSFMVLDISNPSEPKLVGQYTNSHIFNDIAVSGQYVYLANGANGLIVLDISNPTIPQLVGKLSVTGSDTEQVVISDKYIYALNSDSDVYSLEIVNIANPKVPTLVDQDYYTSYPEDPVEHYSAFDGCGIGAVSGNYIYMIPEYGGLAILKTEIQDDGPTEGSLVQVQGSPEVYLIENGFKRHFTSPEALEWNGYSFNNVIQVSSGSLDSIQNGADISITQVIIDKYHALGGSPIFGQPMGTGELNGALDSAGNYCSYVNFQNGAIDCFKNGPHAGEAYAIFNPLFTKWGQLGYGASTLGYPIEAMSEPRNSKYGTSFRYQNFTNGDQRGALEYNINSGKVVEIHGAIFAKWAETGFASGILGLVTEDENTAAVSPFKTVGRYSKFENGTIHWISNKVGENEGHAHRGQSFVTSGDLDAFYTYSMKGTVGDLGFPIRDQEDRNGHGYCEFEGGKIEWDDLNDYYQVKLDNDDSIIEVGQGAATPEIEQLFINAYNKNGGSSLLGNPATIVHEAFGFQVQDFPGASGIPGGVIMYNPIKKNAYYIHGAIWNMYYNYPDKAQLGPVAEDEQEAAKSPQGTTGRYTKFQTGTIHWISNENNENIGHPQRGQAFVTYGKLDELYTNLHGTYSDLGFPLMNQLDRSGHGYCDFEAGYIEWDKTENKYKSFIYSFGKINVYTDQDASKFALLKEGNFLLSGSGKSWSDELPIGKYMIYFYGVDDYYSKPQAFTLTTSGIDIHATYFKLLGEEISQYHKKDYYGALVIPKELFPEGDGNAIPIYVPEVVDNTNVVREEGDWKNVRTISQKLSDFDWNAFATGAITGMSPYEESPYYNDAAYMNFKHNSVASSAELFSSIAYSANSATQTFEIDITIQSNSRNDFRAVISLRNRAYGDFIDQWVDKGYVYKDGKKWTIDPRHKDDNKVVYVSLDRDTNNILYTPIVYSGDRIDFRYYFDGSGDGISVNGENYVRFMSFVISPSESKYVRETISPMYFVSNSRDVFYVHSPCDIAVYNPQSKCTGIVDGNVKEEIQNSFCIADEKRVVIYNSTDKYSCTLIGTDNGTYGLDIVSFKDFNTSIIQALDIPVTVGNVHQYTVDWYNLSKGEMGVFINIDNDNDGVFEKTIKTDNTMITATTFSDSKSGGSGGGSSSSSKSSGGGGGGGAGSAEDYANVAVKDVDTQYMRMNANVTYEFTKDGNPVQSVSFYSLKNSGEITSTIEVLNNRSKLVNSTPEGSIYKYVNIWVGKAGFATAANLKDAKVRFKVNSSWLQDMGLSASDVKLQRYNGTAWEVLPTTMESNTAGYVIFEAQTPGFSPFAITAEKVLASSTGDNMDVKSTETEDVGMNGTQPEKTPGFGFSTAILIIGVFAGGYVYLKGRE